MTFALSMLPFALLIAVWVAWSDMKFMKIPNKSVLAMGAVYIVIGLITLPLNAYLWGLALMGIVLIIGFLANMVGLIGAGDAKFAAAMAGVFTGGDMQMILGLFTACLLGAFTAHRIAKHIPPFRAATADWESWTRNDFPMGLALSGTLIFYLIAPILLQ